MTVPVGIDEAGTFQFLIDTGAERTVISKGLAEKLSLRPGRPVQLHSMSEVSTVDTVIIPNLKIHTKNIKNINAPALSQANLGAEGILGVDSLRSQRIVLDFKKLTMAISAARRNEDEADRNAIIVRARSLYGRLILADAKVNGQKVWVIIDTGSQASVGNEALRRKLTRKKRLPPTTPIELTSVTGGTVQAAYTKVDGLVIGGVTLVDMPIAFADVHPFKKLGLTNRPAMLLGMDALMAFKRVIVDFANRKVSFVIAK